MQNCHVIRIFTAVAKEGSPGSINVSQKFCLTENLKMVVMSQYSSTVLFSYYRQSSHETQFCKSLSLKGLDICAQTHTAVFRNSHSHRLLYCKIVAPGTIYRYWDHLKLFFASGPKNDTHVLDTFLSIFSAFLMFPRPRRAPARARDDSRASYEHTTVQVNSFLQQCQ